MKFGVFEIHQKKDVYGLRDIPGNNLELRPQHEVHMLKIIPQNTHTCTYTHTLHE